MLPHSQARNSTSAKQSRHISGKPETSSDHDFGKKWTKSFRKELSFFMLRPSVREGMTFFEWTKKSIVSDWTFL
jgi:hypothetical protein